MTDCMVPKPTSFSSSFIGLNEYWSPADLLIAARVIVLDDEGKVLVVKEPEEDCYRFPESMNDTGDLAMFLKSPFEKIANKIGYTIEKRALPRLGREYKNPHATDWRELEVVACTCTHNTYDPFFITIDPVYLETDQTPLFMDNMQRVTFWFAGRVVSGSPADENVVWMTIEEAEERLKRDPEGHTDAAGFYALEQLAAIWEDPATHQEAEVVGP